MDFRVGIGYDIHRLVKNRKLILGGVSIPYEKGLSGHSDGDVLIHAISDAILGALGEKDIGEYFPSTEPKYKGIESSKILLKVKKIMQDLGFEIVNLDAVIIIEEPKLVPFKIKIRKNLADILGTHLNSINIKAKTNEGLDAVGEKNAVSCWVVVLLKGKEKR